MILQLGQAMQRHRIVRVCSVLREQSLPLVLSRPAGPYRSTAYEADRPSIRRLHRLLRYSGHCPEPGL